MTTTPRNQYDSRLRDALGAVDSSTRLRAALAAGTRPDPGLLEALVERCAVEPDFFVRDMLTWALTRLPRELTVPALVAELQSGSGQARAQALHTLSKIGDVGAWPALTAAVLRDPDDEVARSAWRAAVVLAPEAERPWLAEELTSQLGRGDGEMWRSLSRALVALGEVVEPVLADARVSPDPTVSAHARATSRMLADPDGTDDPVLEEAKRVVALGPERVAALDPHGAGQHADR
ncbi:HEAT repeat domain-containing protein [Nocardia takedensis]|uniref:HEAT repeat domain-containing protein n=1 Tax=Nocardia takedensis TaxID=259390 RepID=UPI0002EE0CFD|nr:HEAT repeat domain-containing protein [Nocardia takedensis]